MLFAPVLILVALVFAVWLPNRVMKKRGYAIGARAAVRCSAGHLYRTRWIEGVSFTAVRLGTTTRVQRCPQCKKWRVVKLLNENDLTPEQREILGRAN